MAAQVEPSSSFAIAAPFSMPVRHSGHGGGGGAGGDGGGDGYPPGGAGGAGDGGGDGTQQRERKPIWYVVQPSGYAEA